MAKGDRKKAKKINKRLGRNKTIKAANKNRGKGSTKVKSKNTRCTKWTCKPKKKTRIKSKARTGRERGKDEKKKTTTNKYTTSETPVTKKEIINETTIGWDPNKSKNPRFL
tara:strand:+ start:375 stop:707 length:333 start_codon:yes stop_codon:yes gene_type:complete